MAGPCGHGVLESHGIGAPFASRALDRMIGDPGPLALAADRRSRTVRIWCSGLGESVQSRSADHDGDGTELTWIGLQARVPPHEQGDDVTR